MMDWVLATGNAGKAREIAALLAGFDMRVRAQSEFGIEGPEETGTTFVENAILKARHAAHASGLPAMADDSGIVVDALGGAPGVYSARYAGPSASDADNLAKLLADMRDVPEDRRGCRFVCVMVAMRSAVDPLPLIATGVWEGRLLSTARGTGGFGYDPIFWVPDEGLSSAELPPAHKNALSHRGQALRALSAGLAAHRPW
ncbi:MAG: RdgB/HAM1 family non-canonical purine NTP pyrophosphatase [Gammaproteobacteria bacterium]